MIDPSQHAQAPSAREETLPLPKWLTHVYYIFPIILYVPDMIFNFYVYSNGVSSFNPSDITTYPQTALWASLAAGIVGMAWLLSVLAPWHWARGNRFQSVMCWFGVVIATGITTWCSLAFRVSKENHPFATDIWFQQVFHINITNFSPTTILVAISPPFWGLFWAIVQPAERRRNAAEQVEEFEVKKMRVQQEAELKKMRAEANAQVRGAQFAGLAASMKAARTQIGAAITNTDATTATDTTVIVEANASPTPAFPAPVGKTPASDGAPANSNADPPQRGERIALPRGDAFVALVSQVRQTLQSQQQEPTWQNISGEIERAGYVTPDRIEIARALRTIGDQLSSRTSPEPRMPPLPIVGSAGFDRLLTRTIDEIERDSAPLTARELATRTGYTFDDISAPFAKLMRERVAVR